MAAPGRLSIGLLMAVVFFVAADFAIVRALWESPTPWIEIAVTTLPMVNLLLLALPRLARGKARPFWAGFEAVGWPVVLAVAFVGWCEYKPFFEPINWVNKHDPFANGSTSEIACLISFAVVFYTAPMLLAAAIAGRLSTRYWGVVERRASTVPEESR